VAIKDVVLRFFPGKDSGSKNDVDSFVAKKSMNSFFFVSSFFKAAASRLSNDPSYLANKKYSIKINTNENLQDLKLVNNFTYLRKLVKITEIIKKY